MTDEATGLHHFCREIVLEESVGSCDELNGVVSCHNMYTRCRDGLRL